MLRFRYDGPPVDVDDRGLSRLKRRVRIKDERAAVAGFRFRSICGTRLCLDILVGMKVAFIGLGNMGQAIARNLLKAGHEVTVYNRTRERAEALAGDGAIVAGSAAEAARQELVFSMLADDHAVEEIFLGPGAALAAMPKSSLHVSLSTISVDL